MQLIKNNNEFEAFVGKELGVSSYKKITQERINEFAKATDDYQWIHVDPEKAEKESPFGSIIAHGYLTVSLLTDFWLELMSFQNVKLILNYGIESLRFIEPVVVNDEIRARFILKSVKDLRGITKAEVQVTVEIKGKKKPALKATLIFLYHFN